MDSIMPLLALIGASFGLLVYLLVRAEKKSTDEPAIMRIARPVNASLTHAEEELFAPEVKEKHENTLKDVKAVYVEKTRTEEHGSVSVKKKTKRRRKRNRKHNRR